MNVNYTGGARKNYRRFSTHSQQDITGTPMYHTITRHRGRGHYSSRGAHRGGSPSKRRKISHSGPRPMPEFDFAHARRDQEQQKLVQREEENERLRRFESLNRGHPYDDYNRILDSKVTRHFNPSSAQRLSSNTPFDVDSNLAFYHDDSNDLDISSSSRGPPSSMLHGSSTFSRSDTAPLTPTRASETILEFSPPPPDKYLDFEQTTVDPRYLSLSSSIPRPTSFRSSDAAASLSIIGSLPLPLSTTPIGTPPPLPLALLRSKCETKNADLVPLVLPEQPTCQQSNPSIDTTFSQLEISPSSLADDPYEDFYEQLEQLASEVPNSFQPLPRKVDWRGPCSVTRFQRDQLSKSFTFSNEYERENEESVVVVSDRMGLGCRGFSRETVSELVTREISSRSKGIELEPEKWDEEVVEEGSVEWDETDFLFLENDAFGSQSRQPRNPTPPLSSLTVPSSISSIEPSFRSRRRTTLSNGPWNNDQTTDDDDEEDNSIPSNGELRLVSSSSLTTTTQLPLVLPPLTVISLDELGDFEDVSIRMNLPRYQTAYEAIEEDASNRD